MNAKIKIDITGPAGNAYYLLGIAQRLCAERGLDWAAIKADMTAADYGRLCAVFTATFGDTHELVSGPAEDDGGDIEGDAFGHDGSTAQAPRRNGS